MLDIVHITVAESPLVLFGVRTRIMTCLAMAEQIQRIVNDLTRIADTLGPERQEEVWRIIDRLSRHHEAWPDLNELMLIRLRYYSHSN